MAKKKKNKKKTTSTPVAETKVETPKDITDVAVDVTSVENEVSVPQKVHPAESKDNEKEAGASKPATEETGEVQESVAPVTPEEGTTVEPGEVVEEESQPKEEAEKTETAPATPETVIQDKSTPTAAKEEASVTPDEASEVNNIREDEEWVVIEKEEVEAASAASNTSNPSVSHSNTEVNVTPDNEVILSYLEGTVLDQEDLLYPNGQQFWMVSDEQELDFKVTVRSDSSEESEFVGVLEPGEVVLQLEVDGDWLHHTSGYSKIVPNVLKKHELVTESSTKNFCTVALTRYSVLTTTKTETATIPLMDLMLVSTPTKESAVTGDIVFHYRQGTHLWLKGQSNHLQLD